MSQIFGLKITIAIMDPQDVTKQLASVSGIMPPTAFGDLWNRTTNAPRPGMPTMSAVFQAVLSDLQWVNPTASPLLSALKQLSPTALSMRFVVDSYQPSSTEPNFTYGRLVGTIGPALAGEAPRSTPRRLAPVYFQGGQPTIFSTYGPAGAVWDAKRKVLILDLGNTVPTVWSPPPTAGAVPLTGWPTLAANFQLSSRGQPIGDFSAMQLKSGVGLSTSGSTDRSGAIHFDNDLYVTYAGIVELTIPDAQIPTLVSKPLTLTNLDAAQTAVQEDSLGRYVDVDLQFFRLDPGDTADVTLWATRFGAPWSGVTLPVELAPVGPASNGGPWTNNDPPAALKLSANAVVTDSAGKAKLTLTAGNPGLIRKYPNGQLGPDGQVYQVTSTTPIPSQDPAAAPVSWPALGQIFLFPGAPINVLVFSSVPIPDVPTWTQHVGPILSLYAKMYPYMKSIIDIGDYDTVVAEQKASGSVQTVLNLPRTNPHHMPIVRDLSRDKLAMINKWFDNDMPK